MEKSAAFMEKNPKIKVASTYATPFVDKVLALFAGGTPPDVLSGDVYNFRWQLVEQGALGPLDAFIRADKFDTSDFDPDILKGSVYNGKQYGLPYFGSASVVGYNKTLLDARGLKRRRRTGRRRTT